MKSEELLKQIEDERQKAIDKIAKKYLAAAIVRAASVNKDNKYAQEAVDKIKKHIDEGTFIDYVKSQHQFVGDDIDELIRREEK